MAKQNINIGTTANDKQGDSLRAAFQKVNANFTELYTALGLDVAPLNLGAFEFTGSTLSTTDSTAIVIDQATTVTSNLTLGGDLTFPNNTVQTTAWTGSVAYSSVTGTPTIPAAQIQTDWNAVSGLGVVLNKPTIPTSFSSLVNSGKTLSLDTDGELALPTNSYTEAVIKELDATALVLFAQKANANIKLLAGATSAGSAKQWLFDGTAGRTMFPNGTVPEHSYGAAGDKEGMVVFSDPYIYYCKTDYVNNTTDIWVRVAWTGTSW